MILRSSIIAASFLGCLALAACSGGGGSAPPSNNGNVCTASVPDSPVRKVKSVGSPPTTCATASNPSGSTCASNQLPLVIGDTTATYYDINSPQTTIKVCAPGSTTSCAVIDSILIDTGSTGLRLFPSAFLGAGSTLKASQLPGVQVPGQTGTLYECQGFLSGNAFGPVATADLYFGGTNFTGQMLSGAEVHIMDPSCASASACSNPITASQFNFNGIMGVGLANHDCGTFCASTSNAADVYFDCTGGPNGNCANIGVPVVDQVANPISLLSSNNNGVVMSFPTPSGGAVGSISGTLTFGIDTASNNSTAGLTQFPVDQFANFTTVYKGTNYGSAGATDGSGNPTTLAFIDSGSNGLFFTDTLTACGSNLSGFYCPASTYSSSATMKGAIGPSSAAISFMVSNETSAVNAFNYALLNLGGGFTNPSGFDWGLPFFYGRTVFVGFVNKSAHSGAWTGPYWAF